MTRLMSVSHTTQQVRDRTKTVTRRLGWWEDKNGRRILKPGDRLTLCEKVMGRRKGEPLVRICDVEVVDVRRERLWDITNDDVRREGLTATDADFGEWWWPNESGVCWPTTDAWARWFSAAMKCDPNTTVTRIEWRYLDPTDPTGEL